jgi:hypothetical protein
MAWLGLIGRAAQAIHKGKKALKAESAIMGSEVTPAATAGAAAEATSMAMRRSMEGSTRSPAIPIKNPAELFLIDSINFLSGLEFSKEAASTRAAATRDIDRFSLTSALVSPYYRYNTAEGKLRIKPKYGLFGRYDDDRSRNLQYTDYKNAIQQGGDYIKGL